MAEALRHTGPRPVPSSWQDKRDRLLFQDSPPATDSLERLLQLVDDTVLPRRLRIHRAGSVVACFLVAHRKLLAMEIAGQPVSPGDKTACAGQFARALERLAKLVPHLAPAAATNSPLPQIDITPCRLPESEARCSAAQLRAALAQIAGGNAPVSALETALSAAVFDPRNPQMQLKGHAQFHGMLQTVLQRLRSDKMGGAGTFRAAKLPRLQVLPLRADLTLVVGCNGLTGDVWAAVYCPKTLPAPESLLAVQTS